MNLDRQLREIIPHRMYAVSMLNYAAQLSMRYEKVPLIEVFVDGKLLIKGNLFAFTNPAIEAGLVHCRALLEFLGLTANKSGRIVNVSGRRPTDIGIEHFSNARGSLPMVTPDAALARYDGGKDIRRRWAGSRTTRSRVASMEIHLTWVQRKIDALTH